MQHKDSSVSSVQYSVQFMEIKVKKHLPTPPSALLTVNQLGCLPITEELGSEKG